MKQCRVAAASTIIGLVGVMTACGKHEPPSAPPPPPAASPGTPVAVSAHPSPTPFDGAIPAEGGLCALDAISGASADDRTLVLDSETIFGGWAGDAAKRVDPSARLVLQGDTAAYSTPLGVPAARPDVAKAHGSPDLENAGFNAFVHLKGMPAGHYRLLVVFPGTGTSCDFHRTIELVSG